jgi:hypothetical protein
MITSLGIFEEQDHCHALQYTFGAHQCVLTTEVHVGLIEELLYHPTKTQSHSAFVCAQAEA